MRHLSTIIAALLLTLSACADLDATESDTASADPCEQFSASQCEDNQRTQLILPFCEKQKENLRFDEKSCRLVNCVYEESDLCKK